MKIFTKYQLWLALLSISIALYLALKEDNEADINTTTTRSASALTDNRSRASYHRPEQIIHNPKKTADLDARSLIDYTQLWNGASKKLSGTLLEEYRYKLISQATNKLSGADLGNFILFVTQNGSPYMADLALLSSSRLLSRDFNEGVVWLSKLANPTLEAKITKSLGQELSKHQVLSLFDILNSAISKQNILTNHCLLYANHDPEKAIRLFMDMRPQDVDYRGLSALVEAAPAGSNFERLSLMIPTDANTIAATVRKSLLLNWTRHAPDVAAQYVVDNPQQIAPAQLKAVLFRWADDNKQAVYDWVEKLPPGKHRDIGYLSISEGQMKTNPSKAWHTAETIVDPAIRDAAIKQVHREWINYDPKAAEAAREDYLERYPPPLPKQD